MRMKPRRKRRQRHVTLGLLAVTFFGLVMALSWVSFAAAAPVERRVLAIYDSAAEPTPSATLIHRRAEMPLNHLGFIVDYHDIRQPLPAIGPATGYAAVLTWFTYELPDPALYLEWAGEVAEAGVPLIIIGGIGGPTTPQNLRALNRVLEPMGIRYAREYVEGTLGSEIVHSDPELIGFERPLDPLLPSYPVIERLSPLAAVALEIQAPAREGDAVSAVVTAGPNGAFIPSAFSVYFDQYLARSQWLVNPFVLFERVLGRTRFPIPDTTTVSGRRLYFSHVDGVGWNNDARIEDYGDRPVKASEVVLERLITPYPDLPVSVGLVMADIDPVLGLGEAAAKTARAIYALPQVEIASHSRTLPLRWSFFESYDRNEEERLMQAEGEDPDGPGLFQTIGVAIGVADEIDQAQLARDRFLAGARDLPRAYLRDPFSLDGEIGGAVADLAALAPGGKVARLYQWSGDAQPFEAAITATRRLGLRNINGGGSRYDDAYPSVGYVSPIARQVGEARQIYAVDADEGSLTDYWNGAYHGFRNLQVTLDRTESPRRLKGIGLHYHVFSGERLASVEAVRSHLERVRLAAVAPVATSTYAAIADGFFSTAIDEVETGVWTLSDRDGLQTVRFDDADEFDIDLQRSEGVVGTIRYQASLYVALDAAVADATVALKLNEPEKEAPEDLESVLLESGRWRVRDLKRAPCGFTFVAEGFGDGRFEWKNVPAGLYDVTVGRDGDVLWQESLSASEAGRLTIDARAAAIEPVEIAVACHVPETPEDPDEGGEK